MAKKKKASAEQIAHQNDYNKQKYDRLSIMLPKGTRDKYKAYAQSRGMSLNALVVYLLDKDIEENKA